MDQVVARGPLRACHCDRPEGHDYTACSPGVSSMRRLTGLVFASLALALQVSSRAAVQTVVAHRAVRGAVR